MPDHSTVIGWVTANEAFSNQYARARETGYAVMADELIEIADDGRNDTYKDEEGNEKPAIDVIARSRLRVDTRKWLLSKALPKIYGDKQQVEHSGTINHSINEVLEAGRQRARQGRAAG